MDLNLLDRILQWKIRELHITMRGRKGSALMNSNKYPEEDGNTVELLRAGGQPVL